MYSIPNSTKIKDSNLIAWDFEGELNDPLQVAIASGLKNPKIEFFSNLKFQENKTINCYNPARHINRKLLINAPTLLELWPQLQKFWDGDAFVSHQNGTEKKYLSIFQIATKKPWIDTVRLARAAYPNMQSHKLGQILRDLNEWEPTLKEAQNYTKQPSGEHDPIFDVIGCLKILNSIIKIDTWNNITIEEASNISTQFYNKRKKLTKTTNKYVIKTKQMPLWPTD